MTVRRVDHAQITVPKSKETEARDFYLGVLGFSEIPKPAVLKGRGGFWAAIGDVQIHVGLEDGFDRHTTRAHLAYEVEGLDSWRARFVAAGLEPQEVTELPGMSRFEARDPFGNRLEMLERHGVRI